MTNSSILYSLMFFILMSCGSNENNSASKEGTEASVDPIQSIEKKQTTEKEATTQVVKTKDPETITMQIRKEYARIEALVGKGELRNKKLDYECPDDPQGGNFVFQFRGDTLLKVNHSFYMGDHYGQKSSYYFQGGELIFGFHRSNIWNFAGTDDDKGTPNSKDDISIQRDYFFEGQLVKQLFKDYTNYSNKKEKLENEIPNKKTGKGVGATIGGNQILAFSTEEELNCDLLN